MRFKTDTQFFGTRDVASLKSNPLLRQVSELEYSVGAPYLWNLTAPIATENDTWTFVFFVFLARSYDTYRHGPPRRKPLRFWAINEARLRGHLPIPRFSIAFTLWKRKLTHYRILAS